MIITGFLIITRIMEFLKKKSGKNKNKLIATYPKNHENFKYSKPMIQFY